MLVTLGTSCNTSCGLILYGSCDLFLILQFYVLKCREEVGNHYFNLFLSLPFLCLLMHFTVRVNVGKYQESQISSKRSNFDLYHPNTL